MISLEELRTQITDHLIDLEEQEKKLRLKNELLHNAFENDEELAQLQEEYQEALKAYQMRKKELCNSPEQKEVIDGLADIKAEIADCKLMLSANLLTYVNETGQMSLKDNRGQAYRIRITSKAEKTDQESLFDADLVPESEQK